MQQSLFTNLSTTVSSRRIIYTPSSFARSSLTHLQETGTLRALRPHKSGRSGLHSYLFFIVLSGNGRLVYDGEIYDLKVEDCVFIDCSKSYSHETGVTGDDLSSLWSLQWCHFYGPNMGAIYRKYQERGGKSAFHASDAERYCSILTDVYKIADSEDYVRDMKIHEKLSSLLTILMEDAWDTEKSSASASHTVDIQQVKEYLDTNIKEKITLDDLAARFFINKFYLLNLFKNHYGITINAYLNSVRVTYIKQQLRFTDKTIERIAAELNLEAAYLSRLFKKIEGISPIQFRKSWRGRQ